MAKPLYGSLELKKQGSLRLFDNDTSGGVNSHYAALKAAASMAASYTVDMPNAAPSADDVMLAASSSAMSFGKIANANVAAGAAIAYSKLSIADGDLSIAKTSGLQSALDGKVDENVAITGATKTKITYDSKGLVTAGADLEAADMPSLIDATKIADGSVTNAEFQYIGGLTSDAQSQLNSKLSKALTEAYLFVGNASNEATGVALSGDISISNAGVAAIASEVIVNADIAPSAAIAFSKLASLSQGSILIGNASSQPEALALGASGYVLKSNGTTATWQPDVGSSAFQDLWIDTDTATKAITHGLGSRDVIVQIYDATTYETIEVDSVVRNTTNQVTVSASEAPPSSGWRVLILKA